MQLREKQKAKRIYGVLESQFRKYFQWAGEPEGRHRRESAPPPGAAPGQRGVPPRLRGFAPGGRARWWRHGHFQVNGRKVIVPSFLAKVGDVIQLRPTSRCGKRRIDDNANAGRGQLPQWLELDINAKRGRHPEPAAP